MNTNLILSIGITIAVTVTTMSLFGGIASNVGAQEQPIDIAQVKNYLTEAMQALDSGNNTMALEQLDLAEAAMTGTTEDDDDDGGEVEEGPGEDQDEPGDVDTNDEEDSP
jgi:hypothetical protein